MHGVGPRVEEPGIGLIPLFAYFGPVWSKNSNALFSQSLRSHHRLLHILHPTYLYPILTTNKGHRL
jgi:hypothetical protein